MQFIRSLIFSINMILSTVAIAVVSLIVIPLPIEKRIFFIRYFAIYNLWALKFICGIRYEVTGSDNIGTEPCVVLAKHQSTWETLALQAILPPFCFVVKKELLWVPFFGWALAVLAPIAINRQSGRNAVQQIIDQGSLRLKSKLWVVIFPEGTRTSYGSKGKYKRGGPMLANAAGINVLPIAHNAGKYWPKKGFIKKPGTIKIIIGEKIEVSALTVAEISQQTEHWIESTMQTLD